MLHNNVEHCDGARTMSLTAIQQIQKLISESKNILIVFSKNGGGDAIGSTTALAIFLNNLGKNATIVSDSFALPQSYKFIKRAEAIQPQFSHLKKFIVAIDVKDAGVESLTYDIKNDQLRISVIPKHGFLSQNRLRTAQSDFLFDLIITLNTADLASLGGIYENNTELFYNVPIANIDHRSSNEYFGQINLVDITASSTSEALFGIMKQIKKDALDEDIATSLLTGIIAETKSFKNESTKPSTLMNASDLIALGADREMIVRHLFRTRTVAALKLWGRALQNLQTDKTSGIVWSAITRDDMSRTGATERDIMDIIDDLIGMSPEAKIVIIFHEHADKKTIHGIIKTEKHLDAKALVTAFSPVGNNNSAVFSINEKTLKSAEETVIEYAKKIISKDAHPYLR